MAAAGTTKSGAAENRHEIVGVVLLTLALLLGLSLLSYSPRDPILFEESLHPGPLENWSGKVGMTFAAGVFAAVGGAAYLLPIALGTLGGRCFLRGGIGVALRSAGGFAALLLFLSMLLALRLDGIPTLASGWVQLGLAGGYMGGVLSELLVVYFAPVGAHIVIGAGLVLSLLVATPVSLVELGQRAGESLATLHEWAQERWARFSARSATKPRKSKEKAVKIIRAEPIAPAETVVTISETSPLEALQGMEAPAFTDPKPERRRRRKSQPREGMPEQILLPEIMGNAGYLLPDPAALLGDPTGSVERLSDEEIHAQAQVLTQALANFGINGQVIQTHVGPVVTMYEFEPAPGVKVARIVNLADDLALALKAVSIRIVAPIPGKSVVGIEVPNSRREDVTLKGIVLSEAYKASRSPLKLALGKDIFGTPIVADLRGMPHLLVAGATGSGKSVGLNTMVLSVLFAAKPDEVKFLMIDPKMLELTEYEGIAHLWRPVITEPKAAARGLMLAVKEMDRRYKLMAEYGARNIDAFNRVVVDTQGVAPPQPVDIPTEADVLAGTKSEYLSEEDRLSAGETTAPQPDLKTPPQPLPYLVIVIDELADLMMVASKEVEDSIARLAQMARAAGIHLIMATQRPSVDVLTGLIKANFPARIAFQVASKTDSRTVLDQNGAEQLLGRGDMLYLATGTGKLTRVHGAYVPDSDLKKVVDFVKAQGGPAYVEEAVMAEAEGPGDSGERDEMYEQAKEIVIGTGQASASFLQRRMRVGYPRAARMIEMMEQDGIVGGMARDGRREVLVKRVGVDEGP